VLTGGPALRFMEHGKGDVSHDVYWFNFVDASVIRLKEIKDQAKPDELVTWLIYRPAYASRSEEMASICWRNFGTGEGPGRAPRLVQQQGRACRVSQPGPRPGQNQIGDFDISATPIKPAFFSITVTPSTPCRSRGSM